MRRFFLIPGALLLAAIFAGTVLHRKARAQTTAPQGLSAADTTILQTVSSATSAWGQAITDLVSQVNLNMQAIVALKSAGATPGNGPIIVGGRGANSWNQGAANALRVFGYTLQNGGTGAVVSFTVTVADTVPTDLYDLCTYSSTGALLWDTAPHPLMSVTSFGAVSAFPLAQGTVSMPPGKYYFAMTGNASVAKIDEGTRGSPSFATDVPIAGVTTSGGRCPSTIAPPNDVWTAFGASLDFVVHP